MTDGVQKRPQRNAREFSGNRGDRFFNTLNHFKAVASYEFYVAPADQNYILSRLMFVSGFYPEAFWQAAQTIEKYLKAIIALNGAPKSKGSHRICDLYGEVLGIAGCILFEDFKKPDSLNPAIWRDERVDQFIKRIEQVGSPDARYGLTGWYRFSDDIFKLDQLVFSLRRLTVGLDWIIGEDWDVDEKYSRINGRSYRDALCKDCAFEPRGDIAYLNDEVYSLGTTKADILHSWNFEFFRSNEDVQKPAPRAVAPSIGPARNSFLSICWDQLHKSGPIDPDFRNGMVWLVDSIKLEKNIKAEISRLIK